MKWKKGVQWLCLGQEVRGEVEREERSQHGVEHLVES